MRTLIAIAALCALAACGQSQAYSPTTGLGDCTGQRDFGSGVLYFACTGENFAEALAQYKHAHPDEEVTAMTGDGNGSHGRDHGYFVSLESRH